MIPPDPEVDPAGEKVILSESIPESPPRGEVDPIPLPPPGFSSSDLDFGGIVLLLGLKSCLAFLASLLAVVLLELVSLRSDWLQIGDEEAWDPWVERLVGRNLR